jgi:GNAT superfamily N-acetyltransferase
MTDELYDVRLARLEELSSIQEIEREAGKLFLDTAYPFIAEDDPTPFDFLYEQYQKDMVWVASSLDHLLVGFAIATIVDGLLHIQEISVRPSHGKRGIGTRLIFALCRWAKDRGLAAITLSTFRDVAWNAPFYSRLGFVVIEESELSAGLRKVRDEEASNGLPIKDRVCMRFDL